MNAREVVGRWCTHACSTGQGCDDCADCMVNGCDTCTSPETSSPILIRTRQEEPTMPVVANINDALDAAIAAVDAHDPKLHASVAAIGVALQAAAPLLVRAAQAEAWERGFAHSYNADRANPPDAPIPDHLDDDLAEWNPYRDTPTAEPPGQR